MRTLPSATSKHFVLHPLATGIFAAIARDGGAAISNAGLIDLGDQALVFDTFLTPQAALDLRGACVDLLGQPPELVINSHYHNDHIWGNQVFAPDAQIVSTARTRDLMASAGAEELEWYSENSAQQLDSFRAQYEASHDEAQRQQLLLWIGYYEGLVEALPHLTVSMPTVTFNNRLVFHGAQRRAELLTFEGAHTESDAVLYLPEERILFMSDLLFVDCHPYLADGDPLLLLEALRVLSGLDAACFVPGHGRLGISADLHAMIEYVEGCFETAHLLLDQGDATEARIEALPVDEKYRSWQLSRFYRANIHFLCERLGDQGPP